MFGVGAIPRSNPCCNLHRKTGAGLLPRVVSPGDMPTPGSNTASPLVNLSNFTLPMHVTTEVEPKPCAPLKTRSSCVAQTLVLTPQAQLSSAHLPDVIQGLTPQDVLPQPSSQQEPIPPDASSPCTTEAQHHARVVAGLLYMACGGLDQAHNLVTPLCWGAPTPYAGRPIPGSAAAQDASYVHALVHRAEVGWS